MYETSSATNVNDLMQDLYTFCTSASPKPAFTGSGVITEGSSRRFHITKTGSPNYFFSFRSFNNENPPETFSPNTGIYMNAGTGSYQTGQAWHDQTGVLKYDTTKFLLSGVNNLSSIVSSHFFYFKETNNYDIIYVVIEGQAGTYQRLMFGIMETTSLHSDWGGSPPLGMFYSGSVPHTVINLSSSISFLGGQDPIGGWNSGSPSGAAYIRVPNGAGTYTGWANGDFSIGQNQFSAALPQVFDMSMKMNSIFMCSPNTFNSMPPLYPVTICSTPPTSTQADAIGASPSNTPWYPVGTFPFLYTLNIANINPGGVITIGSDTYKVFPFAKKSEAASISAGNTYRFGFAIKSN
jgi:hypothetical protein